MLILPAIDILDGKVVRVRQGEESTAKVYSSDPSDVARAFLESGATMAHVVDLNAALHGDRERNLKVMEDILSAFKDTSLGLQLAGGIRSSEIANFLFLLGAKRVVLSSLAYSNLDEARQILRKYGPHRVVLALDYSVEGEVRTGGWKTRTREFVRDAMPRFLSEGFTTFLLTSVAKDGMLQGPDLATLSRIRVEFDSRRAHLIASGGISSSKDLEDLQDLGIEEAIVGKAIYEGKVDPKVVFSEFKG